MTVNTVEQVEAKLWELERSVQSRYLRQGIVLPKPAQNGAIQLLNYSVVQTPNGYQILDSRGRQIYGGFNLAMTAVLVANQTAMRQFVDQELIEFDRNYGYACFEVDRYNSLIKRSKKKQLDNIDTYQLKLSIARKKSRDYRLKIVKKFEKITRRISLANTGK